MNKIWWSCRNMVSRLKNVEEINRSNLIWLDVIWTVERIHYATCYPPIPLKWYISSWSKFIFFCSSKFHWFFFPRIHQVPLSFSLSFLCRWRVCERVHDGDDDFLCGAGSTLVINKFRNQVLWTHHFVNWNGTRIEERKLEENVSNWQTTKLQKITRGIRNIRSEWIETGTFTLHFTVDKTVDNFLTLMISLQPRKTFSPSQLKGKCNVCEDVKNKVTGWKH